MNSAAQTPAKRREIFGWAMYDFANSSYTTAVITVVYSRFFVTTVVPEGSTARDSYWSLAIILSTLGALVLSPLVGAICDYSGGKKRALFVSTAVCSGATMLLYFASPGDVLWAVALIAVSNAAFMLSESFSGSFLPDLATKENMGKVSGLGWGLGYFGGLASLALVLAVTTASPQENFSLYVHQNQFGMVIVGLFYLLMSMFTFALLKDRSRPLPGYEKAGFAQLMKVGFAAWKSAFDTARTYNVLFKFLLAFMVYMAGMDVVIKFVGIYAAEEVKMTSADLVKMFLILQVSAALGALGFGYMESKLGAKKTIVTTLVWWIVAVLSIIFLAELARLFGSDEKQVFLGISLVAGAGIGAIQSSSRAVVGQLSPQKHAAAMFGFWGTFSRLATILGMSFGFLADSIGSRRLALLLVVGFFAAGLLMLLRIPLEKGMQDAQRESP